MTGPTSSGRSAATLREAPTRQRILDLLHAHRPGPARGNRSGLTAIQIGEVLGLHPTTIRFHLDRLEAAGLIRSHLTTEFGVGRPRKVFEALPQAADDRQALDHLALLAGLLSESFSAGISPQEAGERWIREHVRLERSAPAASPGAWLTKLGHLVDILQRWGYSPDLSTTDGGRSCRIDLVDCAFMDLARANPEVVCGIHRGLLTGALDQMGERCVEISLLPFVEPNRCQAFVSTHQPFQVETEEQSDES